MDFLHHLIEDTAFWVAVSTVICFAFMIAKARQPVISGLDNRSEMIRARLDEAETLFKEAEKLVADYQSRQKHAEAEAQALLQGAQRRAETIIKQAEVDAQRAVEHQEAAARLRIERAEQEVISAFRDTIVKAALSRVEAQLNQQSSKDLTSQSLQAISKYIH